MVNGLWFMIFAFPSLNKWRTLPNRFVGMSRSPSLLITNTRLCIRQNSFPVFSSGHPDNSACTDLSAIAVVHIANVMQVFKICTLLLPSEMFNAYPQSLELVEHPKVSCLCVTA
jgi:hypothetical protein